jgi:hypothetical protein
VKYKWQVWALAPCDPGLYQVVLSPSSNETGGVSSFGPLLQPLPYRGWLAGDFRTRRKAEKGASDLMAVGYYVKVLPLRS